MEYPVSLGSLGCALGVGGFIRGNCVHSLGDFGFDWYRWVRLGSLGSLAFALVVDGFIRGRWIRSRARRVSLRSSGVVGFTCTHPVCRWVFPGSLDSLASAFGVVGYMRDICVHSRA